MWCSIHWNLFSARANSFTILTLFLVIFILSEKHLLCFFGELLSGATDAANFKLFSLWYRAVRVCKIKNEQVASSLIFARFNMCCFWKYIRRINAKKIKRFAHFHVLIVARLNVWPLSALVLQCLLFQATLYFRRTQFAACCSFKNTIDQQSTVNMWGFYHPSSLLTRASCYNHEHVKKTNSSSACGVK